MDVHRPTRALAAFAAGLDPRGLPAEVRQKLGWLLLDYLRVASLGARLPWSEWARGYIAVVALPGAARVLFSPDALNPEHATFMNVTFGSSFDGDAEHAGVSGPEVLAEPPQVPVLWKPRSKWLGWTARPMRIVVS
jgi:2-methylcitrate dehydratase PrpD